MPFHAFIFYLYISLFPSSTDPLLLLTNYPFLLYKQLNPLNSFLLLFALLPFPCVFLFLYLFLYPPMITPSNSNQIKVESSLDEKKENVNFTTTDYSDLSDFDSSFDDREFIPEYADEYNPKGMVVALPEDKPRFRNVITRPTLAAMLILVCEFGERGSYYGTYGILNNFVQRPLPDGSTAGNVLSGQEGNAGALGLGLQSANAVTTMLQFLAYLTPLFGGYLADDRFGKFRVIMWAVWIGIVSHILFVIAAIPSVIAHGQAALAPTILGVITLAICTGFIKANLLPLMLDQYPYRTNVLKKLPSGEIIYVDRDGSLERLTMIFYWSINIGAFLQIATSYSAKRIGYWLAFLCPALMYLIVMVSMLCIKPYLKPEIPKGSLLKKALQVFRICLTSGHPYQRWKKGEFWSYAFPENMKQRGDIYIDKKKTPIPWTQQEVRDYYSCFTQCLMFTFWIIFNLNDSGMGSTLTSQAGAMETKGVPNDLFNNFNQVTIVVAIPTLNYIIYPFLEKHNINFKPVYKCFLGFMLGSIASGVSAVLQWRVYETSPCGYYSTNCPEPAPLSAWLEVINYALCALGECFCYTTAYELAYTRAPENAKGLVMALFLFSSAISAAISTAISGALTDPHLIWPFAVISVVSAICAIVFLISYWDLDKIMLREQLEREESRLYENAQANANANADVSSSENANASENESYNEIQQDLEHVESSKAKN